MKNRNLFERKKLGNNCLDQKWLQNGKQLIEYQRITWEDDAQNRDTILTAW